MSEHMSCDKIWDLLSEYCDGIASPDDARLVEDHIAHCRSCASALEFLRETARLLHPSVDAEPPEGLREAIFRVAAGTDGSPVRRRAPYWPVIWRGAACTLAGAGAAGLLLLLAAPRAVVRPTVPEQTSVRPMRADARPGSEAGGGIPPVTVPVPSPDLAPAPSVIARSITPNGVMSGTRKSRPGIARGSRAVAATSAMPSMVSSAVGKEPSGSDAVTSLRSRADVVLSAAERLMRLASVIGAAGPDERSSANAASAPTRPEPPVPAPAHVAANPARSPVRLVAASMPSQSSVATLADLRRELRKDPGSTSARMEDAVRRDRGTLSVDVIRSRF